MNKTTKLITACLFCLAITPAMAEGFRYSSASISLGKGSLTFNSGNTYDYVATGLSASAAVTPVIFVGGAVMDGFINTPTRIDTEGWLLGVGAHFPLSPTVDFVATFSHVDVTVSDGSTSASSDGESVSAGVRSKLGAGAEFWFDYSYDLDDEDGFPSIDFLIDVTKTVSVDVGYSWDDDWHLFSVGGTLYF